MRCQPATMGPLPHSCIAFAFFALISTATLKLPSRPVSWIFSLPPRLRRCLNEGQ
jgi:hypothetical protein